MRYDASTRFWRKGEAPLAGGPDEAVRPLFSADELDILVSALVAYRESIRFSSRSALHKALSEEVQEARRRLCLERQGFDPLQPLPDPKTPRPNLTEQVQQILAGEARQQP
jgi:hypothetical protein